RRRSPYRSPGRDRPSLDTRLQRSRLSDRGAARANGRLSHERHAARGSPRIAAFDHFHRCRRGLAAWSGMEQPLRLGPRLCRFCAPEVERDHAQNPPTRPALPMTKRRYWQALAVALLVAAPAVAQTPDYPDRDKPDIDLYALMSGKCPTL